MRTYLHLILIMLALPAAIAAQDEPSKEMLALDTFLRMSDDQLSAMAAAIDRVRNMSPEQREKLVDQIAAYRKLPALQREQIRSGWASEADWKDWREMMIELSDEERAAIQSKLQAMPFEKRAAHKHTVLEAWRAKQGKKD